MAGAGVGTLDGSYLSKVQNYWDWGICVFVPISGLVGAILVGSIASGVSGSKTIQIEGKSPEKVKKALEKLRSKARIADQR